MFKFWRSPKPAPSPSKDPSPPPPPPRPDGLPASHLHGLGLALPEDFHPASGRVAAQPHPVQDESARRSSPSAAQGASTQTRPQQQEKAARDHAQAALGKGSVLRERNGDPSRSASDDAPPAQAHSKAANAARSLSPASFSPSLDYGERDPTQIYAPTTWSEMAHHELVVNLSPRERTRQEILWEVVASEERYVAELRSLVDLYANPLLHPLVPTPSLTPSPRFGFSPDPSSQPTASTSSGSLPIASRFARTPDPEHEQDSDRSRSVRLASLPDMDPPSSAQRAAVAGGALGRASLPHLPTGARRHASSSTLPGPSSHPASSSSPNLSTRLASAFRARHPLKPPPSGKLHRAPAAAPPEAPLPPELRDALEACVEMLRGHEELSARLKEQWARAFPLVRGLAAIWSDQPWFLNTYTSYILSLEPALSSLDALLPSGHSPAAGAKLTPSEKRLARALMTLEEHAADAGESSLGICLSKPLMRLGKLPLLMQALLYHTDPTTHEWEKTRAMALEVDALVRSIEDEKVEEEERERTRDALARIDGVNDKALMAPRAARILISESPAPSPLSSSGGHATVRSRFSRSAATTGRKSKGGEWLIAFTDVVVRAVKTGETSIPGSFSREKEKRGKQGAPRRAGRVRNTYRFVRVERWEPREMAAQRLEELNERRRAGGAPASDEEGGDDDEEEEELDAESRMSFRYDADSPQPLAPRSFLSPSSTNPSRTRAPTPAATAPPSAKHGARLRSGADEPSPHAQAALRATTPLPPGRFDAPTVSSAAKKAALPLGPASPPRTREREAKESAPRGLAHARDESSFGLYEMWAAQDA
ncbi:hypothetical protein JCM10450v2_000067 [Rhodotorula kratochvilovae]